MQKQRAPTTRIITRQSSSFPDALRHIPSPPKQLYWRGSALEALLARPRIAIVGSRNISPYGRQVTTELAGKLAERGIVVISGLALGVDTAAHRAALEAGGLTIAVLPGPVDNVYPATNRQLAEQIIEQNGVLLSEYADYPGKQFVFKQNFIARNRLVAGLSQAVLITEAAEKSGSLHTARFTLEQGKDVLAVPGDITRSGSVGVNNLIKAGATPVTSYVDVLHTLGLEDQTAPARTIRGQNPQEQTVLDLLLSGVHDGTTLLEQSKLTVSEFNQVRTMLEISGKIRSLGANHWALT